MNKHSNTKCIKLGLATLFLPIFALAQIPAEMGVKESNNPKAIISEYVTNFYEKPNKIPVPFSVDAPLMGNGFTGVAISGPPEKQVYYLARNDFWRLKSSFNQSFPAVLGKLEISLPGLANATYLLEQDLYSAKTTSKFEIPGKEVHFTSYVSAAEDLMVVQIDMIGKGKLEGTIDLELPGEQELIDNPPFDVIFPTITDKGESSNGVFYISRAFEEDVDIPTKAVAAYKIMDNPAKTFIISEAKPVLIVMAFSSNFKNDAPLQSVIRKLDGVNDGDVKDIDSAHTSWWADFWSKSYVNIEDPIIEKQYYLSQYAMASCSRDMNFPPSIFGSWITKERPNWNGDYHLNYNHFAPYYGLFSSNHLEQAIPSNIPLLAQQERGEYYSEKITGIKNGIILPVGAGPLGIETTRKNKLMIEHRSNWIDEGNVEDEGLFYGQKSNSAYGIVNMAQHFYTTYDKEYTLKYYPFVKGVATFWENYLRYENGRYVIYDDAIHEGTVGTVNPILSLGLVRMVMNAAIDMSVNLGIDSTRRKQWQQIIDKLSDYSFQMRDSKKVFRYTEKGTDWWNDNTLGIQHIYPGGQIGLDSDPELLQIAHNTIGVMHRWIDFNGSNSFFPAAVRVGYKADSILTNLNRYAKNTYPNGLQKNNPHGIENMSTVPNTINEMLCMGHGGMLRVFPVWPKNQDASFKTLRTYGAFLVSSELRNGLVLYVDILSEKGRVCTMKNPWPKNSVQLYRNGKKAEVLHGDSFSFPTKVNEKISLKL